MNKKVIYWSFLIAAALLLGAGALAGVLPPTANGRVPAGAPSSIAPLGTAFSYQGYLEDGGGAANGVYDFQFMLYDASSGGSQVGGTVTSDDVIVADGIFTVRLDVGDVFDSTAVWLEIGVRDGASVGAYTTLSPRYALTPAPQALYASHAPWSGLNGVPADFADGTDDDLLASLSCGAFQVAKWNGANWVCAADSDTTYSAGDGLTLLGGQFSVSFAGSGSATTVARSDHDHFGETWSSADQWGLKIENTDTSGLLTRYGLFAQVDHNTGRGLYGYATDGTGFTYGVVGRSDSTNGRGVYGYASATTGSNYGVRGRSDSASGFGVYGYASDTAGSNYGVYGLSDSTAGTGVYGYANATTGNNYGVYGHSDSADGTGVYGYTSDTAGSNYGVYGLSDSTVGTGVYGYANATTGSNYGVYGQSASADGTGVYGYASNAAGTTYGVYGLSNGTGIYGQSNDITGGTGVHGQSGGISGRGVYGYATSTFWLSSASGVYGRSDSPNGRGVYGYASDTSGSNYGIYGHSDSTAGIGVYGYISATTGTNYGVYGETESPDGYGGYFVNDTLSGSGYGNGLYASGYWYGGEGADIVLGGISGDIHSEMSETSSSIILKSNDDFWLYLDRDDDESGTFGIINGPSSSYTVFTVDENGDMTASGTKSAVVNTATQGRRQLYAVESPEVWFEDFGSAKLSNGVAVVHIDPLFAETVNLSVDYHVFLTPLDGWAGLYVTNKTTTSFEVRAGDGDLGIAFDYRLVAKRLGFEDARLEQPQLTEEQSVE